MVSLAHPSRPLRPAAARLSLVRLGLRAGFGLLVLPPLAATTIRLAQPDAPVVVRIYGVETVLIAAVQMAISVRAVRRTPTAGILRALIPALVAGLVVATADVASLSVAFHVSARFEILPVLAYDVVFGLVLALPVVVVLAVTGATWVGGGHWRIADLPDLIGKAVPGEVVSLVIDALALAVAFPLLMLVLAPAIHKRDRLLAKYRVCEREVILMDDSLQVPRRSRRLEYVMAALPAIPLILYGGAVLAYAVAGLFLYPSPAGPLGNLARRADLMHLGPVTGAVLAQAFLVAAAAWIAWVVRTRQQTRVVLL